MIIIIVVYCRTMLRNVVLVKLQSIVFDYFGFVNFLEQVVTLFIYRMQFSF